MKPAFKAHPWHGISPGKEAPALVTAFVEIVPTDTVKYEIDKESGYLKIDRPQKFSNVVPALYGFIPRTYCGEKIAGLATQTTGQQVIKGDGDPLDICILTEKNITHGDILLKAIPIGGFCMLDKGEADDKIIAVLQGDEVYGQLNDLSECAPSLIDRLKHYFLTYKSLPGSTNPVTIARVYSKADAHAVINASFEDYSTL